MKAARLLVVSPHLDDAVLSAWSVLSEPGRVEVVNVFSGIPRPGFVTDYDRLVRATDSAALVEQRLREDREALALAGCTPRNLGFLDRQYRDGPIDNGVLTEVLEVELRECSGVLAPAGIGAHPDHVAVRDVCIALASARNLPISLYAELPYAAVKGWPHWVTGLERDPYLDPDVAWEADLASVPCPRDALHPEVRRLSDAQADEKLAALMTYRTQFLSLNSGAINRLSGSAVRRYELLWHVAGPNA